MALRDSFGTSTRNKRHIFKVSLTVHIRKYIMNIKCVQSYRRIKLTRGRARTQRNAPECHFRGRGSTKSTGGKLQYMSSIENLIYEGARYIYIYINPTIDNVTK